MTRDRPIDRVLDHWFADGPNQMPDRVFHAVLDQVERTPQRRLARLTTRFVEMPTIGRLAAIAAVILLAAGVGWAAFGMGRSGPDAGQHPTPSTSATATPARGQDLVPLPPELQHAFLGPQRDVPELAGGTVSGIDMRSGGFAWETAVTGQTGPTLMRGSAGINRDGLLELTTNADDAACGRGETGRYRFRQSTGGNVLTIEAGTDQCAIRAEALPGQWQRSDCPNRQLLCLGELEAGRYSSLFFDARLSGEGESVPQFGGLQYEVPAGWANAKDFAADYRLLTADAYRAGTSFDGAAVADQIGVYAQPAAATEDCEDSPQPGIAATPDALADWLLGHEGLVASEQSPVTVDGRPARVVDIEVETSWTGSCDGDVAVPLFVNVGSWHAAIFDGDRQRVVLADAGGGDVVVIFVDSFDPADLDALVAAAMPVIETMQFADNP